MKKDQDSKFAKSFSDALRLWLRANRNRVILIAVLFVLALSFFAGEKLFSDPGDKRRNETAAETGQDTETKEHVTRVVASDTEPEISSASEDAESEEVSSGIGSSESDHEETSPLPNETSMPSVTPMPPTEEPSAHPTVTPVPPTEESTVQPTVTPTPPVETESETPKPETEAPTSPEAKTEAEEGYILCTITVSCEHVYDNPDLVPDEKWLVIPKYGLILHTTTMKVKEGSTVYQVLRSACEQNGILLDAALFSPYVRGIGNLYEFDLGRQSGWMYEVNGYYPPVGCGSYRVEEGDVIVWNYTCNRGDLQPEGEKDNGSNLK